MIRIPVCLSCEYYNAGKCPAYPKGIPDEILVNKKMNEDKCGKNVRYKKK